MVFVILFLMGFFPELLLLRLDGGWKLLGLAYPALALAVLGWFLAGDGAQGCGMPSLALLILTAPFFVGIAAAVIVWLFARLVIWLGREDERQG